MRRVQDSCRASYSLNTSTSRTYSFMSGRDESGSRVVPAHHLLDVHGLARSVASAIGELLPGPFTYSEGWDEATGTYWGLAINKATSMQVVIDSESLFVAPNVVEANRPEPPQERPGQQPPSDNDVSGDGNIAKPDPPDPLEEKPTRNIGTVKISPDRLARDIHQVIETLAEFLGCDPKELRRETVPKRRPMKRKRRRQERWSEEDRRMYQRHLWRSEGFHGEAKTWPWPGTRGAARSRQHEDTSLPDGRGDQPQAARRRHCCAAVDHPDGRGPCRRLEHQ